MEAIGDLPDGNTESIHHVVEPGMYFAFKRAYKLTQVSSSQVKMGHPQFADQGSVLLVKSVDYIDDKPHTIIMNPHPDWIPYYKTSNGHYSEEIKFLVDEFADLFEFAENADRIRTKERLRAEDRIKEIQEEMRMLQEDPAEMSRRYLAAQQEAGKTMPMVIMPGRLTNSVETALEVGDIDGFKRNVEAGSKMIQFAADTMSVIAVKLGYAVAALAPYYQEKATLALAQIKETVDQAETILEGVKTLDLWVGKEVEVEHAMKGASAAKDEPLHVYQRIIFIAPELAGFEDISNEFTKYDRDTFIAALKAHPQLLNSIIPSPRAVVAVATRKDEVDYGNWRDNAHYNAINRERMLLIRDGENLFIVDSPLWPHRTLPRLFPSKSEIDSIYRKNGNTITFRDLAYTEAVKKGDQTAMIYKRLMVLLGGLQARTEIFGKFCNTKEAIGFVSHDFQNKYMRFVHDDDGVGMLPGEQLKPLYHYLEHINQATVHGSHIFYDANRCINPRSAPSAFTSWGRGFDINYDQRRNPIGDYEEGFVATQNNKLALRIPCEHVDTYVRTNVTSFLGSSMNGVIGEKHRYLGWVNMDAVLPEELNLYIADRSTRDNHWVDYLRLFKQMVIRLESREQKERTAYDQWRAYANPLTEAQFRATVRIWRIAHPNATLVAEGSSKLMRTLKRVIDIVRDNVSNEHQRQAFEQQNGNKVIYSVTNGAGEVYYYAEKADDEKNNILHEDVTLWRYGLHDQSKVEVRIRRHAADMLVMYEDVDRVNHYLFLAKSANFLDSHKAELIHTAIESERFDWALDLLYTQTKDGQLGGIERSVKAYHDQLNAWGVKKNGSSFFIRDTDDYVIPLAIFKHKGDRWGGGSHRQLEIELRLVALKFNQGSERRDEKSAIKIIHCSMNKDVEVVGDNGNILGAVIKAGDTRMMGGEIEVPDGVIVDAELLKGLVDEHFDRQQIEEFSDIREQHLSFKVGMECR